jgi:hypothetical protein
MFDFLNPEDTLLLTQFPRFARAPEFASTPPLRFSPHRILQIWGLTNGTMAVMIDCMHGDIHLLADHVGFRRSKGFEWDGCLHQEYA